MSDIVGLGDCDWLAIDSLGQLGYFTSAGSEFVPKQYWRRPDLIAELAREVKKMPGICGYRFIAERQAGGCYESWTNAAEKGLYGYDYDLYEYTGYKVITVPECPIRGAEGILPWAHDLPFFSGVFGSDPTTIPPWLTGDWMPRSG